ncbi:MAG: UDP-N-acetylmuramate dehydrogenase [Actinobacteria bacterium]|nr:UDP-N-acetylmuramate dehydrogenase [Actinomycetota bacterium]
MTALPWTELARERGPRLRRPVRRDASLAEFSTYRLGGPAAVLVEPETVDELEAVRGVLPAPSPVLVVGRGSNLLVADAGFPGVAVHLSGDFEDVEIEDELVTAGGAVALPVLARRAAAASRTGLEFLVGIPGSVGGAVRMNAGGHGQETREVLEAAWVFDLSPGGSGSAVRRAAAELDLGYRHSNLTPWHVVTRASFVTAADDRESCEARLDEIVRWRREHQPGGSNAGSVFTNPPGDSAGRIIDGCGLKGFRIGGAVVSEKHANFFQAEAGATADDVHRLVREVQRLVEEQVGVKLVPELTLVGFSA